MKKIKIAFCLSGLAGGVGMVIFNYFDHLNLADYEIDVITQNIASDKYVKQYETRGFHIIPIPTKKESLIKNVLALYKIMRTNKYDIVHAHMTVTNCFPLFIAMCNGVKVRISHSHMAARHTFVTRIMSIITKMVATDYLACGQDAGRYLYGRAQFYVLNNAIELDKYKFSKKIRKEVRRKLGIPEGSIVIGHVGRFTGQKNHKFIIDFFEEFYHMNKSAVLLLVGCGELFDDVKAYAEKRNLESVIIFTGIVNDVQCKLQAMDLFLLPSLYEGLCLSAIEAQATGVPCVFSGNVSPETKVNENVSFVDLQEPMSKWIEVAQKLISNGRETSSENFRKRGFDIKFEALKLDRLYKSIYENTRHF